MSRTSTAIEPKVSEPISFKDIAHRTGFASKASFERGYSFSKLFFILIIICTIAYLSLQIQKQKFDKKHIVALLALLVLSLFGGLFILKLPTKGITGPAIIVVYILKFLFIVGPLVSFVMLEILMGRDKF